MQSLFPTPAARGAAQAPALHKFNAGKCVLTPATNGKFMISADPRRGQIQLTKGQDGILHFKWVNLVNGTVEDDRMVFGGDCSFKRVKTGREDPKDRVYMLKFRGAGTKPLMFWMQDIDGAKDEENVKKTNDILANPAAAAAPAPAVPATPAGLFGMGGLGGVTPGGGGLDWMQNFGLPNAQTPAGAAPATAPAAPAAPFGNLDLSSLLANLGTPANPTQPLVANRAPSRPRVPPTPNLEDVLNAEQVVRTGVLDDPAVQANLIPHLPAEQQSADQLHTAVRSPQLQQSLRSLTHALRNPDNFQSVMSNFGIDPAAGDSHIARGDGVGAFLAALQATEDAQRPATTSGTNNTAPAQPQEEEKKDENEMDQS